MRTPCSSFGRESTSLNRCMSSEFLREALVFSFLSQLWSKHVLDVQVLKIEML